MEKRETIVTGFALPLRLYEVAEATRRALGLSRSRFYQLALASYLERLNVLSQEAHRKKPVEVMGVM